MQENAEEATGPTWAKKKDQRVTRVGKIMRPCHLDEIPQFVNVLKGDMSLVGPRPERPEFVPHLNREIPNYGKRLESKPGITGLAQICCGYDSTVNDVARKLAYDLYYIRNRSVLFDIVILFKTIQIVVLPNNRLSFELKRLPDSTSDADDLLPLEEASHTAQNGRRLSRAAN
jgi:lipopolysaccharide/colanic/teichoic acid biosynthesis glycosyltransferase